jgi:predicted site-specific integrase-resolvase
MTRVAPSPPFPGWLTRSEAERALGLKKGSLARQVFDRRIRGVQDQTGRWWFAPEEVERYAQQQRNRRGRASLYRAPEG